MRTAKVLAGMVAIVAMLPPCRAQQSNRAELSTKPAVTLESMEQRLGPFTIAGQSFTLMLQNKRVAGAPSGGTLAQTLAKLEICDQSGAVLYQKTFPYQLEDRDCCERQPQFFPIRWQCHDATLPCGVIPDARIARRPPPSASILRVQGCAQVSVFRAPRVAVLSTGDELRDITDPDRPGSIVNSNAYALHAALTQCGVEPVVLPAAKDEVSAECLLLTLYGVGSR